MTIIVPGPEAPPTPPEVHTHAYLGDSGIIVGGTDAHGVRWSWQRGSDLWGAGPNTRARTGENTNDHGNWDSSEFVEPRTQPLEVVVYAPTHEALHDAKARWHAAISPRLFTFRGVEPGYDRWARMRRASEPQWTEDTPRIARATAQLVGSDPRLYSTVVKSFRAPLPPPPSPRLPVRFPFRFAASEIGREVVNAGNDTAWPKYRLVGPMPNPSITNPDTGQVMRLDLTLADGEWLTIDTHPRIQQILLFGDPDLTRAGRLRGDFWGLQPGLNRIRFRADRTGVADQFFGEVADTWI